MRHCDEIEDETTRAKLTANLSRVYTLIGSWRLARDSLLSALVVFEEKGDKLYLCRALLSLGYVCCLQRDFADIVRMKTGRVQSASSIWHPIISSGIISMHRRPGMPSGGKAHVRISV